MSRRRVACTREQGHKKISPFFIPYAITNMGGALLAIDLGFMVRPGTGNATRGGPRRPRRLAECVDTRLGAVP